MKDAIDQLLDNLETMFDAADDMWEEEKYANYREQLKIKEERYLPAKQAARDAFKLAVSDLIRLEVRQQMAAKNWDML
jgi:hypothetical protein